MSIPPSPGSNFPPPEHDAEVPIHQNFEVDHSQVEIKESHEESKIEIVHEVFESDPKAKLLKLFDIKSALEREIQAKEEAIHKQQAELRAKEESLKQEQQEGREESKFYTEELKKEELGLKAAQLQLATMTEEYNKLRKQLADKTEEKKRADEGNRHRKAVLDLEKELAQKESDQEFYEREKLALGLKAETMEELEGVEARYRSHIQVLREREIQQKDLVKNLDTTNKNWRQMVGIKEKEGRMKNDELGKLQAQLKAVSNHVSTLESDLKAMKSMQEKHAEEVKKLNEERETLGMEVKASRQSCETLQKRVSEHLKGMEDLENEYRDKLESLQHANDQCRSIQEEIDSFNASLYRAQTDYTQLDHRLSSTLQPEEAKVRLSSKDFDSAVKILIETHKEKTEFLQKQRDGLTKRLTGLNETRPKREELNLDMRYSLKSKETDVPNLRKSIVSVSGNSVKTDQILDQLKKKKEELEKTKNSIDSLNRGIEKRNIFLRKTGTDFADLEGKRKTMKRLALGIGLVLGLVLEYYIQ